MDTHTWTRRKQAHSDRHTHTYTDINTIVFWGAHVWCKYLILLAHYITDTDGRTHTLIHTLTLIYTGTY